MEFRELTPDEEKQISFVSRSASVSSEYDALFDALASGKKVLVPVPEGTTPKSVSHRLYTASKARKVNLNVRTIADKTAVVVTLIKDPAPPAPVLESDPPPEPRRKQA